MGPHVASVTLQNQQTRRLDVQHRLLRRCLRGKPHHTGREKAQGGDCFSKAGLAVDMGRDALYGLIFVDNDLIRYGVKITFSGQPFRQLLEQLRQWPKIIFPAGLPCFVVVAIIPGQLCALYAHQSRSQRPQAALGLFDRLGPRGLDLGCVRVAGNSNVLHL